MWLSMFCFSSRSVGCSVVSKCGIAWSYSLFLFYPLNSSVLGMDAEKEILHGQSPVLCVLNLFGYKFSYVGKSVKDCILGRAESTVTNVLLL